jgi:hypothetical protein
MKFNANFIITAKEEWNFFILFFNGKEEWKLS